MELFQMRYFVAVAEALSFRQAAESLHISSPSLSVQIRKLEIEIGTDLFIRSGNKVGLTHAGEVFLDEARRVLSQAERSVIRTRQSARGALRLAIGCNAVAEFGIAPRIVPAFKQAWPDAQITLRNLRTPEQFAAFSRNELDVGFICPPVPTDDLDVLELTREPFVAVLSAQHPLAQASTVSFEALSEEPLILYSRVLDPHSFAQIEQHFERAGSRMNVVYELESAFLMINFVAAGHGCCIVPEYACDILPEGTVCKPLEPPHIVRTLALAKRKNSSDIAESFYRFAVEHLAGGTFGQS